MFAPEVLIPFSFFAFVTSITPGPNNVMLLASGVNFGFVRTIPHILGISLGFAFMVIVVGYGWEAILSLFPGVLDLLRYVGGAYLVYLSWKIGTAGEIRTETGKTETPLGFWGAAAFQWANPKAWAIIAGAVTLYIPHENYLSAIVTSALIFSLINAPCVSLWAYGGSALRQWLTQPLWRRAFNITMAVLLLASLYPLLETTP